ncbi:MAG: hypothetical protein JW839_02180 [Candidatus Lokiarchaeota archaeon]|nr:hypothetical protein [Candidatus Lokiarchaeota archaeon]
MLRKLFGYQRHQTGQLKGRGQGLNMAIENLSQLSTRPQQTTAPKDRLSFTNQELYSMYDWLMMAKQGVEQIVNSAFAMNLEPPVKPAILSELVRGFIQVRIPGYTAFVHDPDSVIMAIEPYHDLLMSGWKISRRTQLEVIMRVDEETHEEEVDEDSSPVTPGGLNKATGEPNAIDIYVNGVCVREHETDFELITNPTIHHGWKGDQPLVPSHYDLSMADKIKEQYANFCVLAAIGFVGASCNGQDGVNEFYSNFDKPATTRAYAWDRRHIEEVAWVGPGDASFDPLPFLEHLEQGIRENFHLDKLYKGGELSGSGALAGESDYYATVSEWQAKNLPNVIKVLKFAGPVESLLQDTTVEPTGAGEIEMDMSAAGADPPEAPGEAEAGGAGAEPAEEVDVFRKTIKDHEQFRFPDPRESSTAQTMTKVATAIQAGGIAGIDPASVIREINSMTGWSLEFSAKIYEAAQAAMAAGPANEVARAKGDASHKPGDAAKRPKEKASKTRDKVGMK